MEFKKSDYRDSAQAYIPLTMRFADVDMMHVVHHTTYLHWFEQMRFDFMKDTLEISMAELIRSKTAFPLTECRVKFRQPIRITDTVYGLLKLNVHKNTTFTFSYWILTKERRDHSVEGSTTHCYVDGDLRLMLRPPELFRAAIERAANRGLACIELETYA